MNLNNRLARLESIQANEQHDAAPMTRDDILREHGFPGFEILNAIEVLEFFTDLPKCPEFVTRGLSELRSRNVDFGSKLEFARTTQDQLRASLGITEQQTLSSSEFTGMLAELDQVRNR